MDEEQKDSVEATGDAEQPMTEQVKKALFYASQAEYTLFESKIALPRAGQREEIAFQYMLEAFRLAPSHNGILVQLFNMAELCGTSIFDVLTKEEIEKALEKPENREATAIIVSKTLQNVRKAISQGNRAALPSTPAGIMLLEIIAEKEPTAIVKVQLAVEYVETGRHLEALQLLKEASEENPGYAYLYIEHAHHMQRYQKVTEYWERFHPTVSVRIEAMVIESYIREYSGQNSEERFEELFTGIPIERYEQLKKAKAIAKRRYYSSRNMEIGDIPITSAINYANILYREANIINRLAQSVDRRAMPDVEELRHTSRAILRDTINTLQSLRLCDTDDTYKKLLVVAKTRYLSASVNVQQRLSELEQDIAMAETMLQSGELEITGEKALVENNLGLLMNKKFIITNDETDIQKAGALFRKSLTGNWRDFHSYSVLMQHYGTQGDLEMVYTTEAYRGLAAILDRLIQVDTVGRSQDTIAIGIGKGDLPRMDTGKNFLDDLITVKREGLEALIFLEEYFKPLYEAIKPYTERYMAYLRTLVGDSTEISHRVKKPGSLILKMLKKDPTFSVNSDLVGFRAITETEEEARTLYERVKEDMDPTETDFKEWKTLDDPTPAGYRSLDITGRSKSCGFLVQVQIRPKKSEEVIKASKAHHAYYKIKSGTELEQRVNENPLEYLERLRVILSAISEIYRKLKQEEVSLNLDEIINLYQETIDRLMREEKIDPASESSTSEP